MECFILAGGESRRFGNDKLLVEIGSKRVIERVFYTAKKVCSKVYVVAKESSKFGNLQEYVVIDSLPYQSPIVGIYTALEKAQGEEAMILSGDIPLVKAEVLKVLRERFTNPITVFSVRGKLHPLLGVYSHSLLGDLRSYIEEGGRSVVGFIERVGYHTLKEDSLRKIDPELESFVNMNTKEDFRLILERII